MFLVLVLMGLYQDILLHCLHHVFGIQDKALFWFKSYLANRFQMVSIQDNISDPVELCYDIPQGSVLGPIIFIFYTQPLTHVIF